MHIIRAAGGLRPVCWVSCNKNNTANNNHYTSQALKIRIKSSYFQRNPIWFALSFCFKMLLTNMQYMDTYTRTHACRYVRIYMLFNVYILCETF